MTNYCFLLRQILELLKNNDLQTKEASSKSFFEIDHNQEIFHDVGNSGHGYDDFNQVPSEKQKLREFPMEFNSTTELSSLPTECLCQIFKNVDDNGLVSCLLVCRSWCRNVVPILWSKPFKGLPKDSRYKLIRTYLTCLSREEKTYLNSKLLRYRIRIPDTTQSLFNYPVYLKELSYIELYNSVDSGIKFYRKSFIGRNTYKLTCLLTESICKTFLTKNTTDSSLNLQTFNIDKTFVQTDTFPDIELFSKVYPGLSQLTNLTLNYNPNSENLYKFLQSFPSLCVGLNHLDVTLPYFEVRPNIIDSLISIIGSQISIQSFNFSGARIGVNQILSKLLSEHSNHLISMKFQNVDFNHVDLHALTSCKRLENLTIYHCTGLNRLDFPSANLLSGTSHFDDHGMRLKSLNIGCSPIYSQIPTVILNSPLGTTCRELCLDLITPEIIDAAKRYCQNVTTLKLKDYFIINNSNNNNNNNNDNNNNNKKNNNNNNDIIINDDNVEGSSSEESSTSPSYSSKGMLRELFHGLSLEKLIISINPKNSDYEELNIHGGDLPASCWYLKLQCGFSVERLIDLLLSDECIAPISVLTIDYSNLHLEHFIVIRDLIKKKKTLEYLNICGKKEFNQEELEVIKELQDVYKVNVDFNESSES